MKKINPNQEVMSKKEKNIKKILNSKTLEQIKKYLAALTMLLVAGFTGFLFSFSKSNVLPNSNQELSSTNPSIEELLEQSKRPDSNSLTISVLNSTLKNAALDLRNIKDHEQRKQKAEVLFSFYMTELKKNSEEINDVSLRLLDIIQTLRTALTIDCKSKEATEKFLAISESEAIQLVNGVKPVAITLNDYDIQNNNPVQGKITPYQQNQLESKIFNTLLCNPKIN